MAEDLPQEGWFVGVNGVPLGPIPLGDLRELAMAGHIDRRSLVWREGQGEWRPLAKFAGLARVIDDGASPVATPRPEPPAPSGARSNGANGHIATGFDVVPADVSERPSAWGDLDDEDDEDEQPTTVKGRVSVMPSAVSLPPPPSVAPSASPGPPGPPPSAANPYGMTSSVLAVPTPLQAPASLSASPPLGHSSTFGVAPEAVVEGEVALRRRGRGRWYLLAIVIALAFAFALGAFATQLMRSSSDERASDKSSSSASNEKATRPSAALDTGDEDEVAEAAEGEPSAKAADEPLPSGGGARRAAAPGAGAERAAGTVASRNILGATVSAAPAAAAPSSAPKAATGSLLAGLGNSPAAGPSLARSDERAAGTGLDATAIQRTVRRYSPGVRQNCWQRALNARAPGVPSSAKVTATITVDGAGHVQAVTVTGAPKGYPGLSRCIEGAVKGWQFPRAGAQTVTNVPFMFVGQ